MATVQKIRNGHQLVTGRSQRAYTLVHTEGSANNRVFQNKTAPPSQGDFESTALLVAASGSGLGRFADAPGEQVVYANGKESCIWGGEEMRCSGLFTVTTISEDLTDLTFTAAGDTIVSAGSNFETFGIKPGDKITVSGTASNNRDFHVKIVNAGSITTKEDAVVNEGGGASGTITVTIPRKNPIDYTDAINNQLKTAGNIAQFGGGIDSKTLLMLHCDGDDTSTTFTDSSDNAHTVVAVGDAKLTTGISKFGTASGYFDATATFDYLTITDDHGVSDWWNFGTDRFAIEMWVRFEALPAAGDYAGFVEQRNDGSNEVQFYYDLDNDKIVFRIEDAGVETVRVESSAWSPSVNRWYHIMIVRGWGGNANDWAITIDGQQSGSTVTDADGWPDLDGFLEIGRFVDSGATEHYLQGWLDEVRITDGIAPYTANFTPLNHPYRPAQRTFYVFATRALQGVHIYIAEANVTTSTMSGTAWTGKSFTALSIVDGTASGGISLAQDGEITFSSTVGDAKPFHFEGLYFYCYQFTLSAGSADVYHATVDADWQDAVDVWDGVFRQPTQFQVYDSSDDAYKDYTPDVYEPSYEYQPIGAEIGQLATADKIIAMFDDRVSAMLYTMVPGKVNTASSIPTIKYWNGTEYVSPGEITDTTIADDQNWATLGQSGQWSWNPPGEGEEEKQTFFGVTGYAYEISFDVLLSGAAVDDIIIDTVTGIPVQKTVKPFKFPVTYKNQVMLAGFTEGNEGNRVDYCMPNAADVYNGDLTSDDGAQSLYFGSGGDLSCGIQLYNRFGANIFATLLMLKPSETYLMTGDEPTGDNAYRIYPISYNIGCPAPLTLTAAEMGYQIADDVPRNVAIWLSYSGPVIFDGAILAPLQGVNKFFDTIDSDTIKTSIIDQAVAWYDRTWKEWNLVFPSGSAATNCNKWLCFSFTKKRWFEKVPPTYPQCGFPVTDANGISYVFGGLDTGYMMRLENGNDWDGTDITQTVEGGDFLPTGNAWDIAKIRRLKVIAKRITEAGQDLAITHYLDTATSGSSLTAVDMDSGTDRLVRDTQNVNKVGWAHRFKFSGATSAEDKGLQLLGWGVQVEQEDEDI